LTTCGAGFARFKLCTHLLEEPLGPSKFLPCKYFGTFAVYFP